MGTVALRDRLCTNTVHLSTSTMKFMISFVVLVLVAGINAAPNADVSPTRPKGFFENEENGLTKIGEIQASIVNIGYGAEDLNRMEGALTPLIDDESVAKSEEVIKEAMDADDLANAFNHPKVDEGR